MDVDPSPSSNPDQPSVVTPAARVAELNDIDNSISTLLAAASDAIGILSNSPTSKLQTEALRNASAARKGFVTAADTYFSTLSAIEVRLRRQVYALEEADLIAPGDDRDARRGRNLGGDGEAARFGGGPLDPSWLNARATDRVESGMKRELLEQAKTFVARMDASAKDDIMDTDPVVADATVKEEDSHKSENLDREPGPRMSLLQAGQVSVLLNLD